MQPSRPFGADHRKGWDVRRILKMALFALIIIAVIGYVIKIHHERNYGLDIYLQFALSGLANGSVYALVALGFVTVFNVTGIINFAQGDFVMLGGMLAVTFSDKANLPLPVACLLAIVVVTIIGGLMERLTIYPARHASVITLIIITIGVSLMFTGAALLVWGTDPYRLSAFTTGAPLKIGGAVISRQRVWIMGTTAVVLVGLYFLFEHTLLGKALRACSVNKRAARLMGISPSRMSLFSFAFSAALGAIGGVVFAPVTLVNWKIGLGMGLKGFVAAIMGGMTNSLAAVIGGLLIGVLESLGVGFLSAGFKEAIAYFVLFLILFYRPEGILGSRETAVEK